MLRQPFTVIKQNAHGQEELRYEGTLLERTSRHVVVRAIFQAGDYDFGFVCFNRGDIFTEWFFADRWYNIFRIEDQHTGKLKGYYCNFTRPASIGPYHVGADDLALDLFVHPDGAMRVLDHEEYEALRLADEERRAVREALHNLTQMVQQRAHPFTDLHPLSE